MNGWKKKIRDEWIMLLLKIGTSCERLGKYGWAIAYYRQAIKVKPNFPYTYHFMGYCYLKGKHYEQAIASYKRGLKAFADLSELVKNQIVLSPPVSDSEVYKKIGFSYYELKDYSQAIDYLRKSIELDENNANTYGLMGDAYEKLEEYFKAIDCYQKAREINPHDKEAMFGIGKCYAMLALKEHSFDFFKQANIFSNRALSANPHDDRPLKIKEAMVVFMQKNTWIDGLDTIYSADKKILLIGNPDIAEYQIIDGCEAIGKDAFCGCTTLQQIHIPNSVTVIESSAFEGCENLQQIYIPESVKTIESLAFAGCKKLQKVDIPESVTEIGLDAFPSYELNEIDSYNIFPPCSYGTDQDEMPEGFGEFGLEITNPIPTSSISQNRFYLDRLRTIDNSIITYSRIGSMHAKNIESIIDGYMISVNGKQISTLYICPYNKKTSTKAPKGFKLV